MNYSAALSFTFEDEEWVKKTVIGGLIAFVSFYCGIFFITGFFILGYYVALLRNVLNGVEKPLPDWSNFGNIFVDGVMGGIIFIVYFVVIGLICALPITQLAMDPYMPGVEKGFAIALVSLLTLFAWCFFINAAFIQYAATNNFAAAFKISGLFNLLRSNLGNFLAIIIFSTILNGILFLAGLGIVSPFTNFWGLLVQAHLFGQCAKEIDQTTTAIQSA
ncbi:MAG: DUF4013 domain-containing protein [bacterium]